MLSLILESIPKLADALRSVDPLQVAEASIAIRKILSVDRNPPIDEVLRAGILPRLRELLNDDSRPNVQLETCWSLTNIASGSADQTQAVVESGVVPLFVQLLGSSDTCLQEQAVWALANIAGDRPEYRDGCISVGTVEALARIVESSSSVQMTRLAVWGISNMCRGRPSPDFEKLSPCLPCISKAMIASSDTEVLADASWALSYLTDNPSRHNILTILSHINLNRIIALLGHPSSSVHTPVLRVIGNLVSGDSDVTRSVVDSGALQQLKILILSNKKSVRKESLWAISNICADSHLLIQKVIESGIMQRVCDILKDASSSDADIRTEAAWTVCNACTVGKDSQIRLLATDSRFRVVELLSSYLESCHDSRSIITTLDAIFAVLQSGGVSTNIYTPILEECGGLTTVENLQEDESEEVYKSAVRILESFFNCHDINEDRKENTGIVFDFTGNRSPFARSG